MIWRRPDKRCSEDKDYSEPGRLTAHQLTHFSNDRTQLISIGTTQKKNQIKRTKPIPDESAVVCDMAYVVRTMASYLRKARGFGGLGGFWLAFG